MKTNRVIAKIPGDYRSRIDAQSAATEYGYELYDRLIAEQLPEEVYWVGDDLVAPIDYDGEIDIESILDKAAEQIMSSSDEAIWET